MNKIMYILGSFLGVIARTVVRWFEYAQDGYRDAFYWQERAAAKVAHPSGIKVPDLSTAVHAQVNLFASMIPTRGPRKLPED